jgi:hypothetical protein
MKAALILEKLFAQLSLKLIQIASLKSQLNLILEKFYTLKSFYELIRLLYHFNTIKVE